MTGKIAFWRRADNAKRAPRDIARYDAAHVPRYGRKCAAELMSPQQVYSTTKHADLRDARIQIY